MMLKIKTWLESHLFAVVVLVGWLLTCFVSYAVKYWVYGGGVNTGFMYILLFVPAIALGNFLKETEEGKEKLAKHKTWMDRVSMAVSILLLLFGVIFSPYEPFLYTMLILFVVVLYLTKKKNFGERIKDRQNQVERSVFLVSVYLVLMIVPNLFCLMIGVESTDSALEKVEEQGYSQVRFVEVVEQDTFVYLTGREVAEINGEMGYYLCTAQKDGQQYGVAVSLIGGKIAEEVVLSKDKEWSFYLDFVS